jgi:hypothetical protein
MSRKPELDLKYVGIRHLSLVAYALPMVEVS